MLTSMQSEALLCWCYVVSSDHLDSSQHRGTGPGGPLLSPCVPGSFTWHWLPWSTRDTDCV